MRFDTRLVHVGQTAEPGSGDVVPPVHLAATYDRDAQDEPRNFYSRGENPTREDLERCLASLEQARFATVYSSGQAAAATALGVLATGRCVVSSDDVYGGTHALFELAGRRGTGVEYTDLADPAAVSAALHPDRAGSVGLVWVETPTNPLLKVADLAEVCRQAHRIGATVLVDNTLASPVLQQPLREGADVTLYSTTKSIAGHLDVLGGALVYDSPELHERFLAYRTVTGNVPGALDCFLVHRGLKTLGLRVARQAETTARLAELLHGHPAVGRVHYPGLPGHPGHQAARRQMTAPGVVLSFDFRGDPAALMRRTRLFAAAVSLGGVRSLIECPATMTHRSVPPWRREQLGIGPGLVRLSVGIEDPADLLEDLSSALGRG